MRAWTDAEKANADVIRTAVGEFGSLEVTATGLRKGILDATQEFRAYLRRQRVHNYEGQQRGSRGRSVSGRLISMREDEDTTVSLYRSKTRGDRRLSVTGVGDFAHPNDILAFVHAGGVLHIFDLTTSRLASDLRAGRNNQALEVLGGLAGQPTEATGSPSGRMARLAKVRRQSASQGRLPLAERRAVERRAMDAVSRALRDSGFRVRDVHTSRPWDLEARISNDLPVRVEVKGTTGLGIKLSVTAGEVASAREDKRAVLAVVSGIRLSGTTRVKASNGTVRFYGPWQPDPDELEPIAFSWRAKSHKPTASWRRAIGHLT